MKVKQTVSVTKSSCSWWFSVRCRSFEVSIRAENAAAAQSAATLRWAGETMEPFFHFPEKREDRKNSALMSDLRWLTHTFSSQCDNPAFTKPPSGVLCWQGSRMCVFRGDRHPERRWVAQLMSSGSNLSLSKQIWDLFTSSSLPPFTSKVTPPALTFVYLLFCEVGTMTSPETIRMSNNKLRIS